MSIDGLGWDAGWDAAFAEVLASDALRGVPDVTAARVTVAHRGAVEVDAGEGRFWAEPTGRMFRDAGDARALPVVGDWVAVGDAARARADGSRAALRAILPRRTFLVRRAAGLKDLPQPIVANVDTTCVLTSANQDLNPRRLERYLVAIRTGGAAPLLVLSKLDLVPDPAPLVAAIEAVADGAPVLAISVARGDGLDALATWFAPGRTTAVLGSSGVGKTTLINHLLVAGADPAATTAAPVLATKPIRAGDDKGVHTTTRRELVVTAARGIVIDTPGMRELALFADDPDAAFDDIDTLAAGCRFADCRHRAEPGCAVAAAVASGDLDAARLASFHKLADERAALARRNPGKAHVGKHPGFKRR